MFLLGINVTLPDFEYIDTQGAWDACIEIFNAAPKVAIDLERWMPVPQIVPGRFAENSQQVFIRAFPIGQAGEHADGPRAAPARSRAAARDPELE